MPYFPPVSTQTNVVTNTTTQVPAAKRVNAQTGTSYTLTADDASALITLENDAAITVTVPASLPIGTVVELLQLGTGQVSVTSDGTISSKEDLTKLQGQYSQAMLIKTEPTVWVLTGDLG